MSTRQEHTKAMVEFLHAHRGATAREIIEGTGIEPRTVHSLLQEPAFCAITTQRPRRYEVYTGAPRHPGLGPAPGTNAFRSRAWRAALADKAVRREIPISEAPWARDRIDYDEARHTLRDARRNGIKVWWPVEHSFEIQIRAEDFLAAAPPVVVGVAFKLRRAQTMLKSMSAGDGYTPRRKGHYGIPRTLWRACEPGTEAQALREGVYRGLTSPPPPSPSPDPGCLGWRWQTLQAMITLGYRRDRTWYVLP